MDPAPYLALVVGLAVVCQWVAWRAKVPALLVLLVAGFTLGRLFSPDEILGRELLFAGVQLAVGIILFEGALGLRFRQVRDLGVPILRLCSRTVVITWVLVTLLAWGLGFDLRAALLVGAILTVTGPTVINPILRTLRPTRRVSQLLRWEGIVVDAIGAILGVLVLQVITSSGRTGPLLDAVITLLRAVGIAVLLSVVVGWLLTWMMRRDLLPDYLQGVTFLAAALGTMTLSNAVQSESGLLTVTLLGILLANQPGLHIQHIIEFLEHLQVLFVGALFVILAGRVEPRDLVGVADVAGLFVLGLLAIRAISIAVGLAGTEVTKQERTLMMAMAPRGIIAASITSIFALEFTHAAETAFARGDEAWAAEDFAGAETLYARAGDLYNLAQEVDRLVPLVFLVIVSTVAIYGLGVGRLAERLGLATVTPRGVLFAGSAPWVVAAAKRLRELQVPTLIVARERGDLRQARMSGLRTETASIISEYAVEDMDLAGIRSLVCATRDDNTNAIAASEFSHVLGRSNVHTLKRHDEEESTARRATAGRLKGNVAFSPPTDYDTLLANSRNHWRVTSTVLTDAYSADDFWVEHPRAIVLFVHSESGTNVASGARQGGETGDVFVAMIPDAETEEAEAAERRRTEAGHRETVGPR
ncbi:sodium/proton antiporter, CPA1 family [Kytococcus aerolatus]|uniref:Sodium/proton antiporter, CPA1 family n=1 Tax=Kytococcus aerolatus TaxID=592308 RepID=A0A212T7J3_9MICO|nr:sodium:proton antiporter [Kytococcus aerolatus]SNC61965.1 sodium/proton antiporter, CPA1 family [Kytococcus aerolatus]